MEEEKKSNNFTKNFLIIFITFIITSILISGAFALYIAVKNPFNIQACILSSFLGVGDRAGAADSMQDENLPGGKSTLDITNFDHPLLSSEQEDMLTSAGIDVGTLPTTISPEMEACFMEKLSKERVEEIINGGKIGPLDVLRAGSCLNN